MPKNFSCNLSSINLAEFVKNPYTYNAEFDYASFGKAVFAGVRYLDQIIDLNLNRHPLKEQRENSYNFRNIGLGAFGYGTALMKMNIKYGSQEALNFTDELFSMMFRLAVKASSDLAAEKGSFPAYSDKVWESKIIKSHFSQQEIDYLKTQGLRNCSLLSIAPTGSLSTLLGESGGVEPEFAISYTRRTVGLTDNEDHYYKIYCKTAKEYMELNNTDILPNWFVSALEINPFDRIKVQAIMQNHIDTAISSTINLPEDSTEELMEQLYLEAWKEGLKGLTIFRANCNRVAILTTGDKKENKEDKNKKEEITEVKEVEIEPVKKELPGLPRGAIIDCSNDLIGKKRKLVSGCGSLHVEAWFDPVSGDLQEVFLNKGSTGGCLNFMNGLSRLISLACRAGVSIYDIKDQLDSTGTCPSYNARRITKHDTSKGACCPMAVGNALLEMYQEMQSEIDDDWDNPEEKETDIPTVKKEEIKVITPNNTVKVKEPEITKYQSTGVKCPECGEPLVFEGGCNSCKNCGYSKCD